MRSVCGTGDGWNGGGGGRDPIGNWMRRRLRGRFEPDSEKRNVPLQNRCKKKNEKKTVRRRQTNKQTNDEESVFTRKKVLYQK